MTLDYWWEKRNNRRAARLPDLAPPFGPKDALPGTPVTRLAACLAHSYRNQALARVRAAHKRAWLLAREEEWSHE